MIVVLADDFSGAAEIAGVASCQGLSAEVQIDFQPNSPRDVLVVDTNTRSLPPDDASARVGMIATEVLASGPSWIFKKVDSLLRGPVLAEIEAVRQALAVPRVVLAVSNPSLGRVVADGQLYVHNTPVAETHLARDPEHPIQSSDVVDLLESRSDVTVRSIRVHDQLPAAGICVADATSIEHLARLANALDAHTLAVGAADFFRAVLSARNRSCRDESRLAPLPNKGRTSMGGCQLLVCGSGAAWTTRERQCQLGRIPIMMPPVESATSVEHADGWLQHAKTTLLESRRMMIALGQRRGDCQRPHRLAIQLAAWVAQLVNETSVASLLVEGGATASALVRHVGWSRLHVVSVPAPGVVGLEVLDHENGPQLWVKPGSYDWPASVQRQFFEES